MIGNQFSSNPYGLRDGEVSSGTTIMAVTFDGGVILGADSRTSTGSYVANRVADKVVPIHDYIWCCRSGSAADTQAVADAVKRYVSAHCTELGRLPKVKTIANLMKTICYNNKDRLSGKSDADPRQRDFFFSHSSSFSSMHK